MCGFLMHECANGLSQLLNHAVFIRTSVYSHTLTSGIVCRKIVVTV